MLISDCRVVRSRAFLLLGQRPSDVQKVTVIDRLGLVSTVVCIAMPTPTQPKTLLFHEPSIYLDSIAL